MTVAEKHEAFTECLHRLFALSPGERYEILNRLVETTGCKVAVTITQDAAGPNEHIEIVLGGELLEIEQLRVEIERLRNELARREACTKSTDGFRLFGASVEESTC